MACSLIWVTLQNPQKQQNKLGITNRKKIQPMLILDFFECSENCDVASNLERYDQTLPHKVEVATVVVYIWPPRHGSPTKARKML